MTSLSEIGVCVHPSFGLAATTKAISYLGVTRVRHDVPMALTGFEKGLCDAGINVCGIIAFFRDGTPEDMQAQLANLASSSSGGRVASARSRGRTRSTTSRSTGTGA